MTFSGIALADMPEKPDELTIMNDPEWSTHNAPGIEQFEEDYGIEVNEVVIPYDQLFDQLTTSIAGGETVDVLYMSNSWHAEMGIQEMILPIDEFLTDELKDQYLPAAIELMQAHEETWGLPLMAAMPYFFYNTEMLDELGYDPPDTWEEVEEISRAAIEEGLADHGLFLGLAPEEGLMVYFDVFLKLNGGQWLSEEDDEWVFNSEAGVEALEYMKHLMDEGIAPRAGLETLDRDSWHSFVANRAPFHFNWASSYLIMQDPDRSAVVGDVGATEIPGKELETYATLGGGGLAIGATTRSPEWAFELLKYVTGEEAARSVLHEGGAPPAWADLYDEPETYEVSPMLDVYEAQMEYAGFRPSAFLTWYSEFRDNYFLPRIHSALAGDVDPQEALDAAQEEAQNRLDEEGY